MTFYFARILVWFLGLYVVAAETTQRCPGQRADIMFLLDSSTSEGQANFQLQLDFVKNLTTIYDVDPNHVQVGLTTFSSDVHHQFWLNSYNNAADLIAAIGRVPYSYGDTNTGSGLNFATTQAFTSVHGMRQDVPHILVVMTDGQSQDGRGTAAMADQAHKAGIEVIAIGIGNGISQTELQAIASDPKHVLTVPGFLALAELQKNLASATCNISVPAPIVKPECSREPADVVFILDSSGSEGRSNFDKELQFVGNFVKNVHIGPQHVQVSLVTFSDRATNEFYLNTYNNKQAILQKLQNVSYRGSTTHTELGLQYARQYHFSSVHGARPNAKKFAIILTDGQSQSRSQTISEAKYLKQLGIKIISVGIGTQVSQTELNAMASDINHVFNVANFDTLHTIQSELENTVCGGTVPSPTAVSFECGSKPADIVFILDSSGSEGQTNFNKQLQFMGDFVNNFHVGPHDVQFGLVTFSYEARNEFYLNTYHDRQPILNKLNHITYIGSTTYTDLGLKYARQYQFVSSHGARQNAQKIAIILTDGQSQSRTETVREATYLKQAGVKLVSIGIGNSVSQVELQAMASDNQHVFTVNNFDALHTIQAELRDKVCGGTQLPTSSSGLVMSTTRVPITTSSGDTFEILPDSSL